MRHRSVIAIPAIAGALLLAACGSSGSGNSAAGGTTTGPLVINGVQVASASVYAQAKQEGQLVVYTSLQSTATGPVATAFKKDTGINVSFVTLATAPQVQRIQTEAGANVPGADVSELSDPAAMLQLKSQKLLKCSVLPAALSSDFTFTEFNDPQGCFYPEDYGVEMIAYNTQLVKGADIPKTWSDLANRMWKGKIGLSYAGVGGSAYSVWLMLRQKYGVGYWQKNAALDPQILDSTATIGSELERGEISVGIVSPSSVTDAAVSGAPVVGIAPADGVAAYPNLTAVLAKAPHPAAAAVFRNWTFTTGAQTVFAAGGDWAIRKGIAVAKGLPSSTQLNLFPTTLATWIKLQAPYVAEWNKVFNYVAKTTS